jgi:hypothetical protein
MAGDLGRVYARPAANSDEPFEVSFDGKVCRGLEGIVRRLDARAVPHLDLYAFRLDRLHDATRYVRLDYARVGDEHHPPDAHLLQLPASLFRGAWAVLQRRSFHGKDGLVVRSRVVMHDELPFPRQKYLILVPASFGRYTSW